MARALIRTAKRTGKPEDAQQAINFVKRHPGVSRLPDIHAFMEQHRGMHPGPGQMGIPRRGVAKAAYRRGRYMWLNQPGGGWSPQTPTVIPHQFEPSTGYPQTWTAEGGVISDPLVYEDEPTGGEVLWSEDQATDTPYDGYGGLFSRTSAPTTAGSLLIAGLGFAVMSTAKKKQQKQIGQAAILVGGAFTLWNLMAG